MTQTLWRIAVDAPAYEAHDLAGKGAEITGGRWNAKGLPAVYTSESRALACLETMVHLNAGGLPLNRYLVQIDVPEVVWRSAKVVATDELPVGWDAEPPGKASLDFGSAWLRSRDTALMVLPSIIVPEERNVLINPQHPESARIAAKKVRKWLYDPRLSKA